MDNKPKKSAFVIFIIFIALSIGLGLLSWSLKSQKTPTSQTIPAQTEVSQWKTFENKTYDYKIQYPYDTRIDIDKLQEKKVTLILKQQAPQLNLIIETTPSEAPSLNQLVAKTIDRICCDLTKEETNFKGMPAVKATQKIEGPENMAGYFEYLAFIRENTEFLISIGFGASQIPQNLQSTIDQVLTSIEFVEKAIEPQETSPETPCASNDDCWCRNFTGAQFLPGKVPSLCNLQTNHCSPCYYR